MFDLKRAERSILVFSLVTLLIGLGLSIYNRSGRKAEVRIGRFDPDIEMPYSRVKININDASAAELSSLKGVGSVTASRILEYRELHGAFASIEEIKKVKGIGQTLFDKIKNDITAEE